VNNVFEVKI